MEIKPIASSSAGNCYLISDGETRLLIEAGIPIKDIKVATDFLDPKIDGCLISHSHNDHARSVNDLLALGVKCYMSAETYTELGLQSPFIDLIANEKAFNINTFKILPLRLFHDVPCLGFYIMSKATKEALFFATDTHFIPYQFKNLDYIMVEANYDANIVDRKIEAGCYDSVAKDRLVKSHMDITTTIQWLEGQNLKGCKRIYLLHLSNSSSDEADFKQRVIEATGVPCTVCPA